SESEQDFSKGDRETRRVGRRIETRLLCPLRQRPDRRSFLVVHPRTAAEKFQEMKPEMRHKLAQLPFEEKIRKVGELIRLSRKVKTAGSNVSEEAALLASLDKAAAELNAGKGVP